MVTKVKATTCEQNENYKNKIDIRKYRPELTDLKKNSITELQNAIERFDRTG